MCAYQRHAATTRIIRISIAVWYICFGLGFASQTTASPGTSRPNNFEKARILLHALYPDFANRDMTSSFHYATKFDTELENNPSEFGVELIPFSPQSFGGVLNRGGKSVPEKCGASAGFWFLPSGRLLRFTSKENGKHCDLNDSVRKAVDSHPEWSEVQITDCLKAEGARFGPNDKEALQQVLALKALSSVLGDHLEVISMNFEFRHLNGGHPEATLEWLIDVRSDANDGQHPSSYSLFIEPFKGRITLLFLKHE